MMIEQQLARPPCNIDRARISGDVAIRDDAFNEHGQLLGERPRVVRARQQRQLLQVVDE